VHPEEGRLGPNPLIGQVELGSAAVGFAELDSAAAGFAELGHMAPELPAQATMTRQPTN
jgi:hypothetical protein